MPKCDFSKVASNFIEIKLRHGCSAVNLLHIFRTPLTKNTSWWLLLMITFVLSGEISFCLYFCLIHDKLLIENWECLVNF